MTATTFQICVSVPDGEASHDIGTPCQVPASVSAGYVGLMPGNQIVFRYEDIPAIVAALQAEYDDERNAKTYRWAMEYFAREEALR